MGGTIGVSFLSANADGVFRLELGSALMSPPRLPQMIYVTLSRNIFRTGSQVKQRPRVASSERRLVCSVASLNPSLNGTCVCNALFLDACSSHVIEELFLSFWGVCRSLLDVNSAQSFPSMRH